jgi:uncharacterized membrane protein YfcA
MPQELILGAIFLVSAFTMSFAGFGFAMISVPLLILVLPVKTAVAIQFPYCVGLFLYQAWRYRDHFRWSLMKPLVVGTIIGITLGAYLLFYLPESVLKRALAVFVAVVVFINLTAWGQRLSERHAQNPWWGRICGFISGSFSGAYTIGGPPAALYIRSVTSDPNKTRSLLAIFFTGQFVIITVSYYMAGLFSWEKLKVSAMFLPVVIVGAIIGYWAFGKASSRLYRGVVDMMLLATAVILWMRS